MKKWANLTCQEYDPNALMDDDLLVPLLKEKNIELVNVIWDKESEWDQYEVALIRTTWDYTQKFPLFLETLEKIEQSGCKLINSLETVKWNSQKNYLLNFQEKGFPIIPTWIYENPVTSELEEHLVDGPVIIKKMVGAGAIGLKKVDKPENLVDLNLEGSWIVQPFISTIQSEGEYSLIYFNKKYSHALLKVPKEGDIRSQEEYGSTLKKIDPPSEAKLLAENLLKNLDDEITYARVDMLRDEKGDFRLMELELIEPCLYLSLSEKAPSNFVQGLSELGYC